MLRILHSLASVAALTSVLLSMAACSGAHPQDEPSDTRANLERQGYKPALPPRPGATEIELPAAHSLRWPVLFQDSNHVIGNSMAQYQPYGGAYWHGGTDLRVKAGAEVRSPTRGRVEAGHYSYELNEDGSMQKYWKPWPQQGSDTYFEVAVITDDGTRYEFHHVNRTTLPAQIIRLVEAGGEVQAGDLLGYAIRWSDGEYHHIHYNVVAPNGIRINPEYISTSIPDEVAPKINSIHAVMPVGNSVIFGTGEFVSAPSEFVVDVVDYLGTNIYQHPPQKARLVFDSGEETIWDFTKTLRVSGNMSPHIWEFFKESLRTPGGTVLNTTGGYGMGRTLVRLKVPAGAAGPFRIELSDQAGNKVSANGRIR